MPTVAQKVSEHQIPNAALHLKIAIDRLRDQASRTPSGITSKRLLRLAELLSEHVVVAIQLLETPAPGIVDPVNPPKPAADVASSESQTKGSPTSQMELSL